MNRNKIYTLVLASILAAAGVTYVGVVTASNTNPDVVPDGKIDIFDLASVGLAYGSQPNDSNYNASADVNTDGRIDIEDLKIIGDNYGGNASNSETNGLSVLDYTLKCLKDNRATVYTQSLCGWCIKQSEELGNMQNEIIWIECDKQSAAACSEIKSTPTWEINGKRYSGFKTIEQLIRITECEIPTGYWMTEDGGVCTAFPEQLPKNSYFIKEAN